jgi:hypothetical protein
MTVTHDIVHAFETLEDFHFEGVKGSGTFRHGNKLNDGLVIFYANAERIDVSFQGQIDDGKAKVAASWLSESLKNVGIINTFETKERSELFRFEAFIPQHPDSVAKLKLALENSVTSRASSRLECVFKETNREIEKYLGPERGKEVFDNVTKNALNA